MSAKYFANCVIEEMVAVDERADFLRVRARGKTAVLGYYDDREWVPGRCIPSFFRNQRPARPPS